MKLLQLGFKGKIIKISLQYSKFECFVKLIHFIIIEINIKFMFHKQISKHIELLFSIKWASSKFDFASETFWVAGSSKDGQYPYCPLPTPLLLKSLENPTTTTRTTATAVSSWSFWQSNNTSRGGQKERAALAAAWQPNRERKRCPADDEQCRMRHQKQQQQQQVRSSNNAAAAPA